MESIAAVTNPLANDAFNTTIKHSELRN